MKGQVKIEFVLGVVVFAILIFYVASQINTGFVSASIDTKLDILKARSITMLDVITKDTENGLAVEKNKLSLDRIADWEEYDCPVLDNYNLGGYRLRIEDTDDNELLFCGYVGISAIRTNVVRSVMFDDGSYGKITMEMW